MHKYFHLDLANDIPLLLVSVENSTQSELVHSRKGSSFAHMIAPLICIEQWIARGILITIHVS